MRRPTLVCSFILVAALAAFACSSDSNHDKAVFSANLTGAAEVPPNVTTASGSTTFDFDGDSTVHFLIEVHAITRVTEARLFSGASGVTGPVRVNLFTGPTTGRMDGMLAQGTFTASDVQGTSLDALLEEMRSGTAYVNVQTGDNPDGAIRGQVQLM